MIEKINKMAHDGRLLLSKERGSCGEYIMPTFQHSKGGALQIALLFGGRKSRNHGIGGEPAERGKVTAEENGEWRIALLLPSLPPASGSCFFSSVTFFLAIVTVGWGNRDGWPVP